MNACRILKTDLSKHKLVFYGAGSAGTGVADEIVKFFVKEGNMTESEARSRFWFVDSKGMVTANRGDKLASHKIPYARSDNGDVQCPDLQSTLDYVQPTALIGLSVQPGAFNKEAIQKMATFNERPIIFPLSNPTSKSECTFEEAYNWTDGRVVFASGSPFQPLERNGQLVTPGQGNNM